MADEADTTAQGAQGTSDGDGKNTGADATAGAGTQTAKTTEAAHQQTDITQTDEFKSALTKAIEEKLPQLKRQARKEIAKEVGGDKNDQQPSVEEIKSRAETAESELRRYRARDQVEAFVADKRNSVQVRNVRALVRYIEHDFEYDDEGKVTNLRDLVTQAKSEAPELFGTVAGSADGGAGAQANNGAFDMNSEIRKMAGRA